MIYGVVPQVMPLWISFSLYRFESNVRSATVLGMVGAGGIGDSLCEMIRGFYYPETAAILIIIVLTVSLIDLVGADPQAPGLRRGAHPPSGIRAVTRKRSDRLGCRKMQTASSRRAAEAAVGLGKCREDRLALVASKRARQRHVEPVVLEHERIAPAGELGLLAIGEPARLPALQVDRRQRRAQVVQHANDRALDPRGLAGPASRRERHEPRHQRDVQLAEADRCQSGRDPCRFAEQLVLVHAAAQLERGLERRVKAVAGGFRRHRRPIGELPQETVRERCARARLRIVAEHRASEFRQARPRFGRKVDGVSGPVAHGTH